MNSNAEKLIDILAGCRIAFFDSGYVSWLLASIFAFLVYATNPVLALEPVPVSAENAATDITGAIDFYPLQGDSLTVSTAPDANGIVRRIEVRSKSGKEGTDWAVFSLTNTSNEQIDKLLVAPRYRMESSGLLWPDLDAQRIVSITPSEGFSLERQTDIEADVFLITLDPGSVITLIAEQNTPRLPKLYLWDPDAYKDTVNSYTLYRGIVLGISGLLAVFLTILFVVKGSSIFPATAALAWTVLAYVCVDFGFWNKIMQFNAANEPVWRAGSEVFLAASLLIFLYAYLNLNRWHSHFTAVAVGWMLGLVLLLGVAFASPGVAAGFARFSFAITAIFGAGVIIWLALQKYDRAIMLIPTWILILAWSLGAWMTVTGAISNDVVQPALAGGMVLIVMMLSFTVMQNAFAGGILAHGLVSDIERQALALTGASGLVWDWDTIRDQIYTDDETGHILGHNAKSLNGSLENWTSFIHPNDRDRFQASMVAIVEHRRGRIKQTFRMRTGSGEYYWFRLIARPMLGTSGEVVRCVGTINDITASKNSEERLLHDAVYDNLTGLENRKLFTNRLETVTALARKSQTIRPSLFHINVDNFKKINERLGISVGDTLLLTIARRLGRLLKEGDGLARYGGDQFVLMLLSETAPDKIAGFADSIRRNLNAPIQFADETIELTASIGIASWTADHKTTQQLIEDAELAMVQAKRFGGNRIEPFRPAFRSLEKKAITLVEDLENAIARNEIHIFYQPIVRLSDRNTVGYEALARWQHPKLGNVPPSEFIALAEENGLINDLGKHVMQKSIQEFKETCDLLDNPELFLSVNISSHELLRHDLYSDIAGYLKESEFPKERLKIELTESMIMRNPEHSGEVLRRIKALGVGLSLDDFGTGYSSLSYLLRFPFDTIKIDKVFVQSDDHKERSVILRSIIGLGQGLNQKLVAEGIESESDAADLAQIGCDYGQGYHFGEPVSAENIPPLLKQEYKIAGQ